MIQAGGKKNKIKKKQKICKAPNKNSDRNRSFPPSSQREEEDGSDT